MTNEHLPKAVKLSRRASPDPLVVSKKEHKEAGHSPVDLSRTFKHESRVEKNIHENASAQLMLSSGYFPKLASLLLIPMILIYPLYPAYAAEADASTTAITTASTTENTTENNTPGAPITPPPTESGESATPAGSDGAGIPSASSTEASSSSSASSSDQIISPVDASSTAHESTSAATTSEEVPVSLPSSGSAEGATASTTATSSEVATTTVAASSTPLSVNETPSTQISELAQEQTTEAAHVKSAEELAQEIIKQKEDSMRASIRKEVEGEYSKGCITLDNIGYYCLKDPKQASGSLAPSGVVTGVDSQLGEGSAYKQIFMTKNGVSTQVTHDLWDNTFPSKDVSGKSIVWQGNVNGRWQIFYADASATSAPSVIALTHANDSNFNPKVDGDDVVWQGWVDGNWEIYLAEHLTHENYLPADKPSTENTRLGIDHTWKVTRITNNSVHDMFPSVSGGLVTWQSFQDNAWAVYAYSIKTGVTTKLSSDGAKSENPRFAITWDERTPEGQAKMVGYDIASGKTIDLTSEARQVNDNRAPYREPQAPISQDNQASLPPTATTTATTSMMKSDGDDGSGNGLGV